MLKNVNRKLVDTTEGMSSLYFLASVFFKLKKLYVDTMTGHSPFSTWNNNSFFYFSNNFFFSFPGGFDFVTWEQFC